MFDFIDPISFASLNSKMCSEFFKVYGYVFDPTFINCCEEGDLAVRIKRSGWDSNFVKFMILPMRGMTLGTGNDREIRDQIGVIYFSFKRESEFGKGDQE